jgi:FkbM family methyltransferase
MFRRYIARHEDESLRWWRRIAAHVAREAAILDIGAYHGEYARAAREVNAEAAVYAFEPNPAALQLLRPACEQQSIQVVEAAIFATDGQALFVDRSEGSHVLYHDTPSDASGRVFSVPTVTLDSWVSGHGLNVALIKIDVEGAEADILRHACEMLRRHHPVILCEILSDEAGDEVQAILPTWYRLYHIDENRGIREASRLTRRRWRNKNWLLIPEEQREKVLAFGHSVEHG